jgi:hypothetical protein
MKPALLIALVLVAALLAWSIFSFVREKTRWHGMRIAGAGLLLVTRLTHVCEELNLFPFMHLGFPRSIGHYLDLSSAILGVALFVIGFLAYGRHDSPCGL